MKHLAAFISVFLLTGQLLAQTPQGFSYQAVARDAGGTILATENISVRITLKDGSGGPTLYQESHAMTTNIYGLFNISVGTGNVLSGVFATIDWGNVTPWMQVEMDPNGGSAYVLMGSQQLMSVPYALYSEESGGGQWDASGNDIHNTNSGNVGIGTTTPQSKLDVAGDIALNDNALHLLDGGNADHVLQYDPLVNGPYLSGYDGGALGTAGLPHSLTWDYNGNVGVRSTLTVDAANANNGTLGNSLQLGGNSGEGIGSNRSGSGTNPNGVDFYTAAVNRMLITQDGKVGIGTLFPGQPLSVGGTVAVDYTNQNNGNIEHLLTFGGSGSAGIGSNQSGSGVNVAGLDFYTNFTKQVSIDAGGNMGIGTAAPVAKLDVTGNVRIADGTQGDGKVLTSDANGNASWSGPVGCSAGWSGGASVGDTIEVWPNTPTTILYHNEFYDDGGNNYDPATGIYTAPVAGIYHCSANVSYQRECCGPAGQSLYFVISVNDDFGRFGMSAPPDQTFNSVGLNGDIKLNQGDNLRIKVWNNSSTTYYSIDWGWYTNILSIHLVR